MMLVVMCWLTASNTYSRLGEERESKGYILKGLMLMVVSEGGFNGKLKCFTLKNKKGGGFTLEDVRDGWLRSKIKKFRDSS
jgi:hypothetical protein